MKFWYVLVAFAALYLIRAAVAKSYIGPNGEISEWVPWSAMALPSSLSGPGDRIIELPTMTPEQRAAIERGGRGGLI